MPLDYIYIYRLQVFEQSDHGRSISNAHGVGVFTGATWLTKLNTNKGFYHVPLDR